MSTNYAPGVPAAPGWVVKVGEGSYRAVAAFGINADTGTATPIIVLRPDLEDDESLTYGPAFYDVTLAPGEPA